VPLKRGPLFGSHQIMRSAFSPPKRTSSTSVMDARSAAASMSNLERQRHTAPRRAVGSTVKRTSRASDNVVITRPLRSAIGTPNLRSQAMLQVQLARGLNQLVRSIARTTRTGASSIALGAIPQKRLLGVLPLARVSSEAKRTAVRRPTTFGHRWPGRPHQRQPAKIGAAARACALSARDK
jgi:hypothetical protein